MTQKKHQSLWFQQIRLNSQQKSMGLSFQCLYTQLLRRATGHHGRARRHACHGPGKISDPWQLER